VQSNDRVVCQIKKVGDIDWTLFQNQSLDERNTYTFNPNLTIDFAEYLDDLEEQVFNYTIRCTNLAQNEVSTDNVILIVDYEETPGLHIIEPTACTQDTSPDVIIRTDIFPSGGCRINLGNDTWENMSQVGDSLNFTYSLGSLPQGTHNYEVVCEDSDPESAVVSFSIDNVAPTNR